MKHSKGFTLAELLIVVAIIAVLVAVSIPVFTKNLERAREAADLANVRAAYAEVMASMLSGDTTVTTVKVDQKQTKTTWETTVDWPDGFDLKKAPGSAAAADYWTVSWNATTEKVEAN